MSGNTVYEDAQMTHKETELKQVKDKLLQQLQNGELPAVAKTTSDIALLLKKKGFFKKHQSLERERLMMALSYYGVPEDKVCVYVLGDFSSQVVIRP